MIIPIKKPFVQFTIVLIALFGFGHNQLCDLKIKDNEQENVFLSDLNTFDRFGSTNNQNKKFNLLSNSKSNDLFRLQITGKLYTAKVIDREQMCKNTDLCCENKNSCAITLSIAVISESQIEPRTFECRIHIEDINDHAPQFAKDKVTIPIKESESVGTVFSLPLATDLDSERFSVLHYKLEDKAVFPPMFSLEQYRPTTHLNLQLIQKLDREKRARYELTLLAIDGGSPPKTGRLIININVIDVNDNPPQLLRTNYITNLEESKFTTQPLLKIEAKDEDEDKNAQLFFKIVDENPLKNDAIKYFRIEQNTGSIFLNQALDFEKQEKHRFFVEVSNSGGNVDTATATVLVNVENLNDEKPEIAIDYLDVNNNMKVIKENDLRVQFVAIATVRDRDKGPGGQVNCRLTNFNDVFELQNKDISNIPIQYNILTKSKLDRESVAYYEIQMECEDKGYPVLRAKQTIKVSVKDVNDNTPNITIHKSISIKENQPAGTPVTQITAIDADEGRNSELIYSISESEEQTQKYLEINPQNGELRTRLVIDREVDDESLLSLPVIVTVTDKGEIPLSSTEKFSVLIEDENDNSPVFTSDVIRFSVTENQPAKYTLGEITVTDKDDTSQLRVTTGHFQNEISSPFTLFNKDGKYFLNTTRSLDWEKEQNFSLKIIASDGRGFRSHTVTSTVIVTVLDENDHAPTIIFPIPNNYTVHKISYLEKSEFVILTVSAVDKDSSDSPNGKFYFQLLSDKELFTINSLSGKITTIRSMTKMDIGKYHVKVQVRDQGNPNQESSISLTLEVDDSKPHSRTTYNDEYKDFNENSKKSSMHYFMSKESFLITSLIILLLFLLLCIFMILYMRHIRGLFPMLPDIFEGCTCFENKRSKSKKNASYQKSMSDILFHESRNFISRNSPLDLQPQVRNNDNSLMPFYFNQYDPSSNNTPFSIDHQLPVSQLRQYETMKYQHYSPTILNSHTIPNCNYDQLFYHHPSNSQCDESVIIPIVSSTNCNNVYDSRMKTVPNKLHCDLSTCHRIVNNIEQSALINDDQFNENRKEKFSSNPCLKSDQSDNFVVEASTAKTPDMRRHNKRSEKIDTYAVTYPKEQSTFV